MKIVVASANPGKLIEVERLMAQLGIAVHSMAQAGIVPAGELPEDSPTFAQNALSKARALLELAPSGWWCLGDDSGLEVDALQGAPGVYSARWAGLAAKGKARDEANNRKLMVELAGVPGPERSARFVCCMALIGPDERILTGRGVCEGTILDAPRGQGGFGYDPYFLPAGFERSLAQLSLDEKNLISHRGRALRALVETIERAGLTGRGGPV